ncbi:MAG: zf-HC2 domain-containing protein [Dysgonamonadaceae bacterium]|jgi:predicted anti-sigma-YlaC factor YlaD|nr:zf-HC2 domain-containing protein [Dysgonamonadaceae bacterium]
MKCLNREEIQLYIDGEMSVEEQQSVSAHLSECADCRLLYDRVKRDIDLLNRIFESRDNVLQEKEIPVFIRPEKKVSIFMKLAVACVTVGVIVLFSVFYRQTEKPENVTVANTTSPITPPNEFPVEDLDPNQQFLKGKMELDMNFKKSN